MIENHNKVNLNRKAPDYFENSFFQRTQLPNGALLVTENIPHVRSVSIGVWVKTGSRYETSNENGISHFVEHMLFKGTAKRSAFEIAHSIEKVGGVLNAFTGKELTCYYAHVLDEHLSLAIDLLTDILTDSKFLHEDFQKEQQVILEEIHDANEMPEDKIQDYFYEDLFGSHPLAQPVLGTVESLQALQNENIRKHYLKNYCADRIMVAAAGSVNHEEICALLERNLANWDNTCTIETKQQKFQQQKLKKYRYEKSLLSHICVGSHALAFADERKYAALILNTLLGGGMSSRLFQTVREKHGLCYNILSYLEFYQDTGVFCIYTGTDRANVNLALELIQSEVDDLLQGGLTNDELNCTQSQLKGSLMLGLEDTSSRMTRIAKMEIYLRNYYSLDEVLEGIGNVKMQDVQEVAQLILNPNEFVTSILCTK
ncbi:MAG: M16 family metallopeptidase [bacterium]